MKSKFWACVAGGLLITWVTAPPRVSAEDGDKPKYTVKIVMKEALKGPLLKKVVAGDATDEEKVQLNEMFLAMAKEEPKKGDAESWKKLTKALVVASKAAVDGDAKAPEMLKVASNCKACHSVHK